jgi:hypothetical protein
MKNTYPPMKMEQAVCSETSAYKIQTLRNYPEESIQHVSGLSQVFHWELISILLPFRKKYLLLFLE